MISHLSLLTFITLYHVMVSIALAEVLVITSNEENTLPVFEVYNTTQDRVFTVDKVGEYTKL